MISDAHEGIKAAIRRVFGAGWQRCRVHWMRNALAYVPKSQQNMAAAALRQAFIQPDRAQASQVLRHVADQLREKWPKLAAFIDESETDVLSYLDFPEQHRSKLHSTDALDKPELRQRPPAIHLIISFQKDCTLWRCGIVGNAQRCPSIPQRAFPPWFGLLRPGADEPRVGPLRLLHQGALLLA